MNKRGEEKVPVQDLMAEMQQHASQASTLLKAMANEQRLLVLCQLVAGEVSVSDLQSRIKLGQSALSQHLALLREAGLVATRRSGQSVFYSLPEGPVRQVMQTLHQIYCGLPEGGGQVN